MRPSIEIDVKHSHRRTAPVAPARGNGVAAAAPRDGSAPPTWKRREL